VRELEDEMTPELLFKQGTKRHGLAEEPVTARPKGTVDAVPSYATALWSWAPNDEGQLQFQTGDLIYVEEQLDANWSRGTNYRTTESGMFPIQYVKMNEDATYSNEAKKSGSAIESGSTTANKRSDHHKYVSTKKREHISSPDLTLRKYLPAREEQQRVEERLREAERQKEVERQREADNRKEVEAQKKPREKTRKKVEGKKVVERPREAEGQKMMETKQDGGTQREKQRDVEKTEPAATDDPATLPCPPTRTLEAGKFFNPF
jgi:Variant SH3 domain